MVLPSRLPGSSGHWGIQDRFLDRRVFPVGGGCPTSVSAGRRQWSLHDREPPELCRHSSFSIRIGWAGHVENGMASKRAQCSDRSIGG